MLRAVSAVWVFPENRAIPRAELLARARDADGLYCMLTDRIDAALLDAARRRPRSVDHGPRPHRRAATD